MKKKIEGLKFTFKGKKAGYASKIANFTDRIIYNKGVKACEQNNKKKVNGNYEEELFDEKTFDRLFKMI